MADLIYIAVLIAFFVVAGLFVVACDRIIGPDVVALAESRLELDDEVAEVAA